MLLVAPAYISPARRPTIHTFAVILRRRGPFLLTIAALAAVAGAMYTFVYRPLAAGFPGQEEDFQAYWAAVTAIHHHLFLYSSSRHEVFSSLTGFTYPPFAALIFAPLGLLNHHWAQIVFLWIDLACAVASCIILMQTVFPPFRGRLPIGILIALTWLPITYNAYHGQVNTLIFLLVVLGFREYRNGRSVRSAIWIALAAGIKVSPALLLILFLLRREWKALACGIASGIGTLLLGIAALGWKPTYFWFTKLLPELSGQNGWIQNQNFNGVINRLFNHSVVYIDHPLPAISLLTLLFALATLVTLVAALLRLGSSSSRARELQFGLTVMAILMAGAISWYPHYTLLTLTLITLVPVLFTGNSSFSSATARTFFLLVIAGFEILFPLLATDSYVALSTHHWLPLQAWNLPFLPVIALYIAVVTATFRQHEEIPSASQVH